MGKKNFNLSESAVFQRFMNEKTKLEGIYGTEKAVKKVISEINNRLDEINLHNTYLDASNQALQKELEETKNYLQTIYLKTEDITEEEKM